MSSPTQSTQALAAAAPPAVLSAIRQASASTGVDFDYLLRQAATESSFDPHAQAGTSSARGLYQFVDSTWLDMVDQHGAKYGLGAAADAITRDASGRPVVADPQQAAQILALRDNPRVSAFMAAEFAKDNQVCLERSLGREVGSTELYLAHFLGAGGATRLLNQVDAGADCAAASVLPGAAKANQGVFFKEGEALSVTDVFERFASKFGVSEPEAFDTSPTHRIPMMAAAGATNSHLPAIAVTPTHFQDITTADANALLAYSLLASLRLTESDDPAQDIQRWQA